MIQAMKNLNLLQTNGMLQTVKQQKINYDAFILVTEDIIVAANNNADVVFKNCAPFLQLKQKLMMSLLVFLHCNVYVQSD